jgi:predicted DsbA family dithiol-disulfide isomerase
VTDGFLRSVAASAGVDATKALAYASSAASQRPLDQANAQAAKLGVNATPTFTIARGNGAPKVVSASDLLAQLNG